MLASSPSAEVSINTDQNRFELRLNGDLVGIIGYYEVEGSLKRGSRARVVSFMHTVVKEDFSDRGWAAVLVRGALNTARDRQWRIVPICTYVRRYLARNPEFLDLVA